MYFHSVYCRCPGGILVEVAATVPGGFSVDEPYDQLGSQLLLPPWFEHQRPEILKMLDPIKVPESNRAVAAKPPAQSAPVAAAPAPAESASAASRRTSATFVGGDKPQKN